MAEKLRFQQPRRDSRAVELDEGAVMALAEAVNRAGDEFLARAGLALDEDGRVSRCDHLDLPPRDLSAGATADDILEAVPDVGLASEIELPLSHLARGQ